MGPIHQKPTLFQWVNWRQHERTQDAAPVSWARHLAPPEFERLTTLLSATAGQSPQPLPS